MESKKEFNWQNYDWSKLKEKQCCPKVLSQQMVLNKQNSLDVNQKTQYFCSYDESRYDCGCHPQQYSFPETCTKNTLNILFIAKLGDMEVFPIIFAMIQMLKSVKGLKGKYYGSDQIVKEISKINQEPELFGKSCSSMPKPKNIEKDELIEFNPSIHELDIHQIITIGGDGTILYAMRFFQKDIPPPIMCFEKGTLGFMAKNNLKNTLRDLGYVFYNTVQKKPIQVEEKMRLEGTISGRLNENENIFKYHALNEIVIERGAYSSVLKVDIYANDVFLTSLWGDGLIISTPTGSTAYNLSAGGPIIQNEVQGITITPICPFSLSFRPLVLPRCTKLKLMLTEDARGHGQICCDGQSTHEFKQSDQIIIKESQFGLKQIRSSENFFEDWADKLKRLLNWNNTNFNKEKQE